MRLTTLKTFIWIPTLLIVAFVIFLVSLFVSRTMLQDSNIPPLLLSGDAQTEDQEIGCDLVVIVMDADGNVYSGKNCIGSLTHPLDLTTKLKEVVEARVSRMTYTRGMDLNHALLLPSCADEPVYVKAEGDANDRRTLVLVRALRKVGAKSIGLIVRKKPQKGP